MAPPKADQNIGAKVSAKPLAGSKMTTRLSSRTSATANMLKKMNLKDLSKRKADTLSPPKGKTTKRSAFFDITNATTNANATNAKDVIRKETAKISVIAQPKVPTITKLPRQTMKLKDVTNQENVDPSSRLRPTASKQKEADVKKKEFEVIKAKIESKIKESTTAKSKEVVVVKKTVEVRKEEVKVKEIKEAVKEAVPKAVTTVQTDSKNSTASSRKSLDDESSLYASALDSIEDAEESLMIITPIKGKKAEARLSGPPSGVVDFDKENADDPCQVSDYAMDVFRYLKSREPLYTVADYMPKQTLINKWMRSLLVDWMVDVQEHFELNHETLYLAVKMLDIYLNKKVVTKEVLQLIGAASIFIASKYDERIPPAIDDILYVCENIYTREELITMEIELFKAVEYCLGMPLSYRFLRRYARCCRTSMPVLTLARYILELSLMEYSMVSLSESKVASAALYLALRMKDISGWTKTLEYYSGYVLKDFHSIALQLNAMLHRKPKEQLRTVRNKYSHTIFFEVAKTPLLDSSQL